MTSGLVRSISRWCKNLLQCVRQVFAYMDVKENLPASIRQQIDQRCRDLINNAYASSRQEAEGIACAEIAGMLVNEMFTLHCKSSHSDLREYLKDNESRDWYWGLIADQLILLIVRSLKLIGESRTIAGIKFRTSLTFELLKQNPAYEGKSVESILCSIDGPNLSFQCLIDSSAEPVQFKDSSIYWFLTAMRSRLESKEARLTLIRSSLESSTILNILSRAVNI